MGASRVDSELRSQIRLAGLRQTVSRTSIAVTLALISTDSIYQLTRFLGFLRWIKL